MVLYSDKTRCALCGDDRFHPVEKTSFSLVVCKGCGLVFIEDAEEPAFYKELYKKQYGFKCDTNTDKRRLHKKSAGYIKWIKRNLGGNSGLRLLEIGCGSGYLLKSLRNERFDVYGIEPGEAASIFARQKNRLPHIENSFLEETKYPENFFDIIVLVQTFEHFKDPGQDLSKIRGLLNNKGLLFIEVPDAFSIVGVYRFGLNPSRNHLYIYSIATIKLLLNKCGFELIDVRKAGYRNIRIVAKKGEVKDFYLPKYKNNYKKFLFVNSMNKCILKTILKFKKFRYSLS